MKIVFLFLLFLVASGVCMADSENALSSSEPSVMLLNKIKDPKYSIDRKIIWLDAFEKLGMHLSPLQSIEAIKYLASLDYRKKNKTIADAILSVVDASLEQSKNNITNKELSLLDDTVLPLFRKCVKTPIWFEKFLRVYLSFYSKASRNTLHMALEKESSILFHYIVELNSEELLLYYLKNKKYAPLGSMLGLWEQNLRPQAFWYLNNKLIHSDNVILKFSLLRFYLVFDSLIYSLNVDGIKSFVTIISEDVTLSKEAPKALAKIFHCKEGSFTNALLLKVEQEGIWEYLLRISKKHLYTNCNTVLAHLTYQIMLCNKTASKARLIEYKELENIKHSKKQWKDRFYFWLICMSVNTKDANLSSDIFSFVLPEISNLHLEDYGNLWLLCYAIHSQKGKFPRNMFNEYLSLIKKELQKRLISSEGKANVLELAACFKFLGYNKKAAEILLNGLEKKLIDSSSDISIALEELQNITNQNHGTNIEAWKKAIDAMPDDGEAPKIKKEEKETTI